MALMQAEPQDKANLAESRGKSPLFNDPATPPAPYFDAQQLAQLRIRSNVIGTSFEG
jgi:hypothetical protein